MNFFRHRFGPGRPMSCRQVGRVLQTYLDDELNGEAARKVVAHLDDCRRCGLEADTYHALKASLQRVPAAAPDEPVARLREFGERLIRGDFDPGGLSTP